MVILTDEEALMLHRSVASILIFCSVVASSYGPQNPDVVDTFERLEIPGTSQPLKKKKPEADAWQALVIEGVSVPRTND